MVGRDVEQHGDIGLELIHVVELETAQLDDIHVMMLGGHLKGEAAPHVTCQPDVQSGLLEDMICEFGRGGLTIAAGDAHHLGIGVSSSELNFAHDGDALLDGLCHHGCRIGYAGALDNLVGIENLLGGVSTLLPRNVILVEQVLVGLADVTGIAEPHVHALDLAKHGRSGSALATTQYY